jgi:hypothetical protein
MLRHAETYRCRIRLYQLWRQRYDTSPAFAIPLGASSLPFHQGLLIFLSNNSVPCSYRVLSRNSSRVKSGLVASLKVMSPPRAPIQTKSDIVRSELVNVLLVYYFSGAVSIDTVHLRAIIIASYRVTKGGLSLLHLVEILLFLTSFPRQTALNEALIA